MKKYLGLMVCVLMIMGFAQVSTAGESFTGIIESRPGIKYGNWVIGDRTIEVTFLTKLDEDNGPLEVGSCAKVKVSSHGAKVKKIKASDPKKCGQ